MANEQVQVPGQRPGGQGPGVQGTGTELTRAEADAQIDAARQQDLKDACFFIECLADDAKNGRTQPGRKSRGKEAKGTPGGKGRTELAKAGDKSPNVEAQAAKVDTGANGNAAAGASTAAVASAGGGAASGGSGAGASAAIGHAGRSLNDWFNPNDTSGDKGLRLLI